MSTIHIFAHNWLVYTLPTPDVAACYAECVQYEVPDALIARFHAAYRAFSEVQHALEAIYAPRLAGVAPDEAARP